MERRYECGTRRFKPGALRGPIRREITMRNRSADGAGRMSSRLALAPMAHRPAGASPRLHRIRFIGSAKRCSRMARLGGSKANSALSGFDRPSPWERAAHLRGRKLPARRKTGIFTTVYRYLTVNALTLVLELPSGFVTVTSLTDLKALAETIMLAVSFVLDTYLVRIVSPKLSMLILDCGTKPSPITVIKIRSPGEAELGKTWSIFIILT